MFYFSYEMGISAGYKYYVDNLVAIARLRGDTLKTLRIAAQDILYDVTEPSIIEEELSLEFIQVLVLTVLITRLRFVQVLNTYCISYTTEVLHRY
jgi:hypothetical protein